VLIEQSNRLSKVTTRAAACRQTVPTSSPKLRKSLSGLCNCRARVADAEGNLRPRMEANVGTNAIGHNNPEHAI
jgi:hypothetical protein